MRNDNDLQTVFNLGKKQLKELNFIHSDKNLHYSVSTLSLLNKLPIPAFILNADGFFLTVNQLFADIFSHDALFMQSKSIGDFIENIQFDFTTILDKFNKDKNHAELELYVQGRFYNSYWRPIKNAQRQIVAIVIVCAEVTKLKRRERVLELSNLRLQEHLYLDHLTGMPNHMALEHDLTENYLKQYCDAMYMLIIDLDDFKKFNQLYGYSHGDVVLKQVAELFNSFMYPNESILYRLNSARFVIVLPNSSELSAYTLSERLRMAVLDAKYEFNYALHQYLTITTAIYHPTWEELNHFPNVEIRLSGLLKEIKAKEKHKPRPNSNIEEVISD